MRALMKGNDAVAEAVTLARVEVIAAYPITPQTSIVEDLADRIVRGELNARFLKVESEHSAMAACAAAAAAGARAFTATSSQGLLLMHEMLHWAAGSRLPIVLAEVNRAVGAPWSLWADQTDSLAQRDTGWMQVYCESVQEVFDTILQAFEVSRRVLLPVMVALDAFFLSHTYEDFDVPEQDMVDRFLQPLELPHRLNFENPASIGSVVPPDRYMEFRRKIDLAHRDALRTWEDAGEEWFRLTGRRYGLIEEYRTEGAEVVLVAAATAASTAKQAIDDLRAAGVAAGLVRLRVFRPFPAEALRRALADRRRVVVLDRNCSFGHHGIFHQEVQSALYSLPDGHRPAIRGVIAGLGGRDITPEDIEKMMRMAAEDKLAEPVTWWRTLPSAMEGKQDAHAAARV